MAAEEKEEKKKQLPIYRHNGLGHEQEILVTFDRRPEFVRIYAPASFRHNES